MPFEDWPTLAEAIDRTKISQRSFYRMIARRQIQRQYRREPGKKPVIVLDPEKINALAEQVLHPILAPARTRDSEHAVSALVEVLREILTQLQQANGSPAPPQIEHPLYVSVIEAARLSGLPAGFIRRKIRDRAIPATRTGRGYRIKREVLDGLTP